jgi:hypothetical protein
MYSSVRARLIRTALASFTVIPDRILRLSRGKEETECPTITTADGLDIFFQRLGGRSAHRVLPRLAAVLG